MQEYNIRRKDRAISEEEAADLLRKAEYGVLACADAEGTPYAVPLSYVFMNNQAYFHCALSGHKTDNIKANSRVSFVVVGEVEAVYDKGFSTYYKSAMINGEVRPVSDPEEKTASLLALAEKYLPDHLSEAGPYIERLDKATAVYAVSGRITGKSKKKA